MDDAQLLRYARHMLLDGIGIEGQEKLLASHALVIGAGGLGSPVVMYLAACGVGTLTVVDHDTVDLTNLQRQIMHATDRVGWAKVDSAHAAVAALNPDVRLVALAKRAAGQLLIDLIAKADVVLDCSDNFATRQAVNSACVKAKKPLISGAAIRWDGQIMVVDPRDLDAPCWACLFPPEQQIDEVRCATMGVFAPMVGIVGAAQASEAVKFLCDLPSLSGRMLLLDGRALQWTELKISKNPQCPVCGHC
jgi:molybdopterin/thiamine biosynthesis adenylyltransferase